MKNINFKYMTAQSIEFQTLNISIEDYFELDKDEICEIDSVPRFLHFHDYIDIKIEDLLFIHVIIEIEDKKREFKQSFWNQGNNFIIERIDTGDIPYKEIIICSDIKEGESEIIRFTFHDSQILPVYHGFISTNSDGTQSEIEMDLEIFINMYKKISK